MKLRAVRLFRLIFFLLILYLLINVANYCLYNDNTYTRVMFHEAYAAEKIDVAFIGSSNVYRHFDPEIWDASLGMKTFNLGTSSQTPDAAYYIMKELFKSQSPEYCIYGINFILFLEMEAYENPKNHYIIFDYLKFSADKCMYAYAAFYDKSMLNAWLPMTRNTNKDLLNTAKGIISVKGTENYRRYGYDVYGTTDTEEYRGKGFVYSYEQTAKGEVGKVGGFVFKDYKVNERYIAYIKKLKELCDKNKCELIFIVPPLPYASMKLQGDYQKILDLYEKIAEELDVNIFNFDLSRSEYLLMEDDDFYDHAHMSGKGAEKFSREASGLIKQYIDGKEINKSEYFYASYEELLNHSPWIFNAWIEKTGDGYTAQSTYGNGVKPEYCFYWSGDKGNSWNLLREYSRDNRIEYSGIPDECNMIMVCVKPEGVLMEGTAYQQCDRMELQ